MLASHHRCGLRPRHAAAHQKAIALKGAIPCGARRWTEKTAVICRNAQDPYAVLGIPSGSDTNTINKAYAKKKAEFRSNPTKLDELEVAHSKLMLSAFSARLKSGRTVPKAIRYADREVLFPWKPKRWDATPRVVMIVGAVQLAMIIYGFRSPNISRVVGCLLIGAIGNVLKQNAISPPPADPNMATDEEQGRMAQNLVRGALLAVFATAIGLGIFTVLESIKLALNIPLPAPVPGSLFISLKIFGTALANWIITAFYY